LIVELIGERIDELIKPKGIFELKTENREKGGREKEKSRKKEEVSKDFSLFRR